MFTSSNFSWNTGAGRYVDLSTGRFIPRSLVADVLEKVITASQQQIEALTQSLLDGNITLSEWQLSMERELKAIHTLSAALARGGWSQMEFSDWGRVGAFIKRQYSWLDNFANEIYSGVQPTGSIMRRAKLYAQSGMSTYEDVRRIQAQEQGFNEERRLLSSAEHCQGCVTEAAKGWQPIGTLRRIGDAECATNCLCRFEFRKSYAT